MKHSVNVDSLRIATPCPMGWEQMTGNDRVRFCDQCGLNVYNIAELSRPEAEALIASSEGRICARLFRRVDGTVLTKDCPVGLRALRMRVTKRVAAMVAAMVATIASLSAATLGQQPAGKDDKKSCVPQTRITRTDAKAGDAATLLSGTVLDSAGAVIPGAKVQITNSATAEITSTLANEQGRFEFASLPAGNYSIVIESPYFKRLQLVDVIVDKGKLVNVELVMSVMETQQQVLVGLIMLTPEVDRPPAGTTIISGDLLRRLPIQK